MQRQQEKKTTELRECAFYLAQVQADRIQCTQEEYRAVYRRFVALLTAWRVAGWQEPESPAGRPASPSRLTAFPDAVIFARAA